MAALLKIDEHDFAPPLLTGEDVQTMTRAGILPEGRGYELIEGVLVKMASQYGPHVGMVAKVVKQLNRTLPDDYDISIGGSIFLSPHVMLEPDVCIYPAGIASHDVLGRDILLAIEVSDSSLRYDLGKKAQLYAAHGVRDYWVIDLNGGVMLCHAAPGAEGYPAPREVPFGTAVPLPFIADVALTA